MNEAKLNQLLNDVRSGKKPIAHAVRQLKSYAIHDLDFARVDGHRTLRKGFPEVIYCEGKTPAQVAKIAGTIVKHNDNLLATRASQETYRAVKRVLHRAKYHEAARCITVVRKPAPKRTGTVAVLCAGTTDIPVAEEAVVTAEIMGNKVKRYYDVGVAGLHRLMAVNHELLDANVLIVVAGMEGALPSVVGGLVDKPVIAVPSSVGYGASFGGIAALLAMLNSCASGITVVNINNGFGAGYAASLINHLSQS
ncbi:MAG: Pyridinium-3,5-biscarboxylic acid mononucleotide synthase [Verrucomicrobiae bacterium]|nr:Pyridinium-3,5-biscarboxylic acid mononucleotide synthase [Verrucomicrobiae bacterium]